MSQLSDPSPTTIFTTITCFYSKLIEYLCQIIKLHPPIVFSQVAIAPTSFALDISIGNDIK